MEKKLILIDVKKEVFDKLIEVMKRPECFGAGTIHYDGDSDRGNVTVEFIARKIDERANFLTSIAMYSELIAR